MEPSLNSHKTKDRRGNGQKVCVRVCVCFFVFTTVVGVSRFYRIGIHLMADGKHQSQGWGWEGFKAGAAWDSVQLCGVRNRIYPGRKRTLRRLC